MRKKRSCIKACFPQRKYITTLPTAGIVSNTGHLIICIREPTACPAPGFRPIGNPLGQNSRPWPRGLLLAELAYIENLGVKNLRTAESGTRVEITQAKNSMAFYSGTTTTPVLEIKTTSDPIYMGQGSGIQAKTGKANISIMNGYLHQGSEGAGVSVPVILIGQPDTISQLTILQNYTNTSSGKYKCGIYLDIDGTQSTASTADKIFGMFVRTGGIFVAGDYGKLRSNNVLSGIVAAGQVSKTGSLYGHGQSL